MTKRHKPSPSTANTGSDDRSLSAEESHHYEILIEDHLDESWSEWFCGMSITHIDNNGTILKGSIVDQPALYGLLIKLRDMGLSLVSVNPIEPPTSDSSEAKENSAPWFGGFCLI